MKKHDFEHHGYYDEAPKTKTKIDKQTKPTASLVTAKPRLAQVNAQTQPLGVNKKPVKNSVVQHMGDTPEIIERTKPSDSLVPVRNRTVPDHTPHQPLNVIQKPVKNNIIQCTGDVPKTNEQASSVPVRNRLVPTHTTTLPPGATKKPIKNNTVQHTNDTPKPKRQSKVEQEIRRYQKTTHMLIPRAVLNRLIKEISDSITGDHKLRWSQTALLAVATVAEDYLTTLFHDSYLASAHAGRTTLMVKDIRLARRIRGFAREAH